MDFEVLLGYAEGLNGLALRAIRSLVKEAGGDDKMLTRMIRVASRNPRILAEAVQRAFVDVCGQFVHGRISVALDLPSGYRSASLVRFAHEDQRRPGLYDPQMIPDILRLQGLELMNLGAPDEADLAALVRILSKAEVVGKSVWHVAFRSGEPHKSQVVYMGRNTATRFTVDSLKPCPDDYHGDPANYYLVENISAN